VDDDQPYPLEDEDGESSMMFLSNADLDGIDPDAPGVKAMQFTPAAQAHLEQTVREFMGYAEPIGDDDDGVDLHDEPDEEFRQQTAARFDALLGSHPDRTSKVPGLGSYRVSGPCAGVDGSMWEYLDAVGEEVDSGNSSEFEAYLDDAKQAFNRSDIVDEPFNPAEEFDDDMARDPGAEAAYGYMFARNDWEARYNSWRAIMTQSRRQRRSERTRREGDRTAPQGLAAAADGEETHQERPNRELLREDFEPPGLEEDAPGDKDLKEALLRDLEEESVDPENEGELGDSDDKPLNPPGVDSTMRRNFARPFQFPGRIKPLAHDGDYSTPDSSSSTDKTLEDHGEESEVTSSVASWEGLNADGEFVFAADELEDEAQRLRMNFTGQEQWEKDVYLRELCRYMPDDAILPEDHARRIRMAVHFGAQMTRSDWWGWYPLHHAAFRGLTTVCRELVKLGADINCGNRDGSTPVMLAARHGRLAATKMLLALGADFRITSKDGETMLDKAIRSEHRRLSVMVFDLFDKSRDDLLSDGRTVGSGLQAALAAAPSNAPTNMHVPASFDSWLRSGNMTGASRDPRLMWRPAGWSYRDIDRHRKVIAEAPEVQAYKEQQQWNELIGPQDDE